MTRTTQWAQKITAAWRKTIDGIFECGDLLIAAKEGPQKLPHGQFEKMIESELPFGPRTAQMYMKIATDARLVKAKRASLLPGSMSTLYWLTTLSDEDFQAALDDGIIHPEMTRDDIPERVVVPSYALENERPKIVAVTSVPAPARGPVSGCISEGDFLPRWSDTANVDRLIDALEQLAQLVDPATVDRLIEVLAELGPVRLSRVRVAVRAISRVEAALKSRLS